MHASAWLQTECVFAIIADSHSSFGSNCDAFIQTFAPQGGLQCEVNLVYMALVWAVGCSTRKKLQTIRKLWYLVGIVLRKWCATSISQFLFSPSSAPYLCMRLHLKRCLRQPAHLIPPHQRQTISKNLLKKKRQNVTVDILPQTWCISIRIALSRIQNIPHIHIAVHCTYDVRSDSNSTKVPWHLSISFFILSLCFLLLFYFLFANARKKTTHFIIEKFAK